MCVLTRRLILISLALTGLVSAYGIPTTTGPDGEAIKIACRARSLRPGEVVLVEVESAQPLRRLRGEVFGREFPVFPQAGALRWFGLAGIDLDAPPGPYALSLAGEDAQGSPVAGQDTLVVAGRQFPTRQLTVDAKFVTPPASALARIREESERVRAIFGATTPRRYWQGAFIAPVPGAPISEFGKRSVYNGKPRSPHSGTDFRGTTGTPVRAPNAGRIVLAASLYYSGNTVIIDHGYGLYSYFGHLSAFAAKAGDAVDKGEVVGKVGATGLVTGPHLHWAVRLNGSRVDPLSLLSILSKDKNRP